MARKQEGPTIGRDLDRRLALAGAVFGVRQRQREGDCLVEGHQTSGGCSSSGGVCLIRRGGRGGADGARSTQRSSTWAAASRPPRPKASAVAIAADPRISPNAIITIASARPIKVRPIAVNKAMIA